MAIGAAVGALAGTALLLRKLRNRSDEDEREDEEYGEDEDEPRGRGGSDDEDDDEYDEDEENEEESGTHARHDDEDEEEDDSYDEDDDEEPRARSSRSKRTRDEGDDESSHGFASTVWEAVLEGVRSGQGNREGKSTGARSSHADDEEDDVSDRKPRGAAKTGRSAATRAPRGRNSTKSRGSDDDGPSIVRQARRHLAELTGHEPESISGLERDGDGRSKVRCEVVELERIPHSTDVLATYELTLDADGRLVECSRIARYNRSSAEVGGR